MKSFRLFLLPLLATALVGPLAAQTTTPSVIKVIEPARIAFINSAAFVEPTTGIKQLIKVSQGLELEFSSAQSELSLLAEKLRTLAGEINKLNADPVANAKALTEKQAEGLRLQQTLTGKQQAAQEAYNKRAQEVQSPVTADISKELRAYSRERQVGLLLDINKLGEAIIDLKPELDLTADFVSYYNAKHP